MQNTAKSLRSATTMSQTQLANVMGVSPITISRWERGERSLDGAALVLMQLLADKHPTLALQKNK
jgi:DNA-binding transcriptional regulator YiaG